MLAVACAAAPGEAGGAPSGGSAGGGAPAATFTQIYAMMFPQATNARCDACHALPANDISNGNLATGATRASAYAALVGPASASTRCGSAPLVVPNHPEMSLFYQKLMETPPCGSRMPLGGTQFTAEQLEMVRSWIAAGALDD